MSINVNGKNENNFFFPSKCALFGSQNGGQPKTSIRNELLPNVIMIKD